jgi:hypothetical protein
MSLQPEKRDRDETYFASELGWLAAAAVFIAAISPSLFV